MMSATFEIDFICFVHRQMPIKTRQAFPANQLVKKTKNQLRGLDDAPRMRRACQFHRSKEKIKEDFFRFDKKQQQQWE